jgi:hypothetical protein
MAELIPPRRNELLTKEGLPTSRFAEYLERLTAKTNSSESDIDLVNGIQVPPSDKASRSELEAIEMLLSQSLFRINSLEQQITSLEKQLEHSNNARLFQIEQQLKDLSLII